MPYKYTDPRRHKFEPARYRITNWGAYNTALRRRGSITFWLRINPNCFIKPPRNLTPPLCNKIQKRMLNACQQVAAEYGLAVEDGGLKDVNLHYGFELSLRVAIPGPDGSVFQPEKAMFEVLAESYGLKPRDFGRKFSTGREQFEITGLDTRRPKYPVSVERIPDRQGFKFTAENVAVLLKAGAK